MLPVSRIGIACFAALSLGVALGEDKARPKTAGALLKEVSQLRSKNLQRTNRFLHIERQVDRIELAFVMDGTESMTEEFASLRDNLNVFADQLLKNSAPKIPEIRMTAVIYRDTGAKHPIQVVSKDFLSVADFKAQFEKMEIDTGEPWYQERVDEGLHTAIEELKWSPKNKDNDQIARLIILCGDAPPYAEEAGDAFRKYTTSKLGELANSKGVTVHCIRCASGFAQGDPRNAQLLNVANQYRPEMIRFLSEVSHKTGGEYKDLSDPDVISKLVDPHFKVKREVVTIAQNDIDEARQQSDGPVVGRSVRVVVLPHATFQTLAQAPWFEKDNDVDQPRPEVLVATEMKQLLPSLGQNSLTIVGDSVEVKARIEKFAKANPNAKEDDYVAKIAEAFYADYVVWGVYEQKNDTAMLTTGIYSGDTGKLLVQAPKVSAQLKHESAIKDQVQKSLRKLSEYVTDPGLFADPKHALAFSRSKNTPESQAMVTPIAQDLRAQRSMLAGLEMLEHSLAYLKPEFADTENAKLSTDLMMKALQHFEKALVLEPKNPIAHLWIACCHYNLSKEGVRPPSTKEFLDHLQKAYDNRAATVTSLQEKTVPFLDESRLKEVEAYHALFNNQHEQAIAKFTELTEVKKSVRGNVALRAHWMLAGIRLGDWDVAAISPKLQNTAEARKHILAIMANWEGTPEARFYKDCVFGDSQARPTSSAPLISRLDFYR